MTKECRSGFVLGYPLRASVAVGGCWAVGSGIAWAIWGNSIALLIAPLALSLALTLFVWCAIIWARWQA